MPPIEARRRTRRASVGLQHGLVTVEMALVLGWFLAAVFMTMEVARFLFVLNTAQVVTTRAARAAAVTDWRAADAIASLKRTALFRAGEGGIPLMPELNTATLKIDYLSMTREGVLAPVTPMPACPQQNLVNCAADVYGASCIRAVRVRICAARSTNCAPLKYQTVAGLVPMPLNLAVPMSTTIVKSESLGLGPGEIACP